VPRKHAFYRGASAIGQVGQQLGHNAPKIKQGNKAMKEGKETRQGNKARLQWGMQESLRWGIAI
jgi:hypothetical protein